MLYCFSSEISKSWKLTLTHTCIHTRSSFQFTHLVLPTLYDPMDCSMPGQPAHHQLPEFTQTYVHWIGDVIQPSYPLSSPSSPAFNLSQHQGIFKWVNFLHQVAKILQFQMSQFFAPGSQNTAVSSVLPMNIQDWFPLGWTGWVSLQSKGLSRVFSNSIFQKHQFCCTQLSL